MKQKILASATGVKSLQGIKHVIAVSSCKGGVGKSTLTYELAMSAHRMGYSAGILDIDIFGPSMPVFFPEVDINEFQMDGKSFIPVKAKGLEVVSFGFLLKNKAAIFRGPMVAGFCEQLLCNTQWSALDFLFIDLPPGTGDIHITLTQKLKIDGALIVTTPHPLSRTDVEKGIMLFEKIHVPILGVIENMAYFLNPNTSQRHYIFGKSEPSASPSHGLACLLELPLREGGQFSPEDHACMEQLITSLPGRINEHNVDCSPVVDFNDTHIKVTFNTQDFILVTLHSLRQSCHCHECLNLKTRQGSFNWYDIPLDIHAKDIKQIGQYGIQILFSDNHLSSTFAFEKIRELALTNPKVSGHV